MQNVSERMSAFACDLKYEDIPAQAIEYAKILLVDYVAASAAGYRINKGFNRAMEEIYFGMGGKEESTVMFSSRKLPVLNAAMMNGVYVHGADLDDGNRNAMGHPGCSVISALLALAEERKASGKEFLTAMAVGYETYVRCASAIQPSHVNRGFHSTGVVGTLAAAMAGAKLMGLGQKATEYAMALAIIQAGGLILVNESGQSCKPINPAKAAYSGLLAARLAEAGVISSENALESTKGLFHAFADAVDAHRFDTLGSHLSILDCYVKPYPACRHTHAGADAALSLRREIPDVEAIESICVHVYPVAISLAGKIAMPKSVDEAKFSIAFALCCAMVSGHFGLDDIMDPSKTDPRIAELTKKVTLVCDQSQEDPQKGTRGASVTVRLKDGRTLQKTVPLPKGDPETAMNREEICDKLAWSAGSLLTAAQRSEIADRIFSLDEASDVSDLIYCLNTDGKELD